MDNKRKFRWGFFLAISFSLGSLFMVGLRFWSDEQNQKAIVEAEQQGLPWPDGPAAKPLNSVVVRVDSVMFEQYVGDDDGVGELSLHTLVARRNGHSARLSYPSAGNPMIIYPRMDIPLRHYSLQIEGILPDEPIEVYFLALDEDKSNSLEQTVATELIMEVAKEAMNYTMNKGIQIPRGDLISFFAGYFVSQYAAWWEEADFIGIYHIRIDPNDYERLDRAYYEQSIDGNMRIRFALLSGYSILEVPVTREVEVTRIAEVTREVKVIHEIAVPVNVEVTRLVPNLEQDSCPEPVNQADLCASNDAPQPIRPVQPVNGEYQNPITFWWNGDPTLSYQVFMYHPESGTHRNSEWVSGVSWRMDIPKEQFGYWEWYVVDSFGRASSQQVFVFNPHRRIGGP